MDSSAVLDRLVALEADVTYREPPADGEPSFRHERGRLPVLLSAPHGAAHRRDGRYKEEDEFTAAFARLIAERTGAHVLYVFARLEDDPNWDRDSPYKTHLRRLVGEHGIHFVMDIHGMSNRHKFGIAVGTMCGASCPGRHEALIVAALSAAGFTEAKALEVKEPITQ
jgi:N-formylglutamate amidohydrolase